MLEEIRVLMDEPVAVTVRSPRDEATIKYRRQRAVGMWPNCVACRLEEPSVYMEVQDRAVSLSFASPSIPLFPLLLKLALQLLLDLQL